MEYISATEARSIFSELLDKAQNEPIIIRRQHKDVAVMISPQEYSRLRRIKTEELDRICERASAYAASQGMTEEMLDSLLNSTR